MRLLESRHRYHFRREPFPLPARRWVTSAHTLQVWVRDDVVNLAGALVTSESGLIALVWHGIPSALNATPFEVISGISTDGSGHTDWQISNSGLAIFDPITFMYVKPGATAVQTRFGARTIIPSYE